MRMPNWTRQSSTSPYTGLPDGPFFDFFTLVRYVTNIVISQPVPVLAGRFIALPESYLMVLSRPSNLYEDVKLAPLLFVFSPSPSQGCSNLCDYPSSAPVENEFFCFFFLNARPRFFRLFLSFFFSMGIPFYGALFSR